MYTQVPCGLSSIVSSAFIVYSCVSWFLWEGRVHYLWWLVVARLPLAYVSQPLQIQTHTLDIQSLIVLEVDLLHPDNPVMQTCFTSLLDKVDRLPVGSQIDFFVISFYEDFH